MSAKALFESLGDRAGIEHGLFIGYLDREMRSDRVGKLGIVVDLGDRGHDLRRDLLVELDVAFELGDDRPGERFHLDLVEGVVGDRLGPRFIEILAAGIALHLGANLSLDQNLDRTVGKLQELKNRCERAGREDRFRRRIVVGGRHLRRKKDELVGPHDLFESANRFLAADEKRHDHVRENHDVAERQDRIGVDRAGASGLALLGHYIILSGEVLIYIEEMAARRFSFKKAAAAPTASRN